MVIDILLSLSRLDSIFAASVLTAPPISHMIELFLSDLVAYLLSGLEVSLLLGLVVSIRLDIAVFLSSNLVASIPRLCSFVAFRFGNIFTFIRFHCAYTYRRRCAFAFGYR